MIDGDTVDMERLGRVRLIGVDTPEQGRCYENAATRFTRERLEGRVVRFELGVERRDRYDRTLAYLSREGAMHNLALLREGYAKVLTVPPNDRYEATFEKAKREARETDEGLWGATATGSPRGGPLLDGGRERRRQGAPPPSRGGRRGWPEGKLGPGHDGRLAASGPRPA